MPRSLLAPLLLLALAGCPKPTSSPGVPLGGGPRWLEPVTSTGPVSVHALAFAGDDLIVGGEFGGTLAIGSHRLTATDGRDGFVARLDRGGNPRWVRRFGGPGDDRITAIAASAKGAIGVGGQIAEGFSIAADKVLAAGEPDGFVAELNAEGEARWLTGLGATRYGQVGGVAYTSGGDLAVAGSFAGTLPLLGRPIHSAGAQDLFALRLRGTGEPVWAIRGGGPGADLATAVAVGPGDRIAIAGSIMDQALLARFGFETVGEDPDALFAGLDAAGEVLWARALGGAGHDGATSVAFAGEQLVGAGQFSRELATIRSSGATDGFSIRLSSSGEPGPAIAVGGAGPDWLAGLDASGATVATAGAITADRPEGDLDVVVVRLADGEQRWRRRLEGPGDDAATAVAVAADGAVAIAGSSAAGLKIGPARLAAEDDPVAFVAVLEP